MSNVATRLLSLILLLQSRASWKASELGDELKVSERTVHRYMGMLEEMGIPIYSERGPYGGFALMRGYKLPPLIFTAEEATVLYMGANLIREVWGRTYDAAVTSVTAKLDNVLPDDLRHEVAEARQRLVVSELTARDYRPWESAIHTLRECIAAQRCVNVQYHSFGLEETERVVEPYALALKWGLWYLVGFCRLRQDLRTFRVDRIRQLAPAESRFSMPRDFDVREYMARMAHLEPTYKVRIHFDARVAATVREHHAHWMEIEDHADGSLTAQFGQTNLNWVTGWLLSFGGMARVIEPQELIDRLCQAAESALRCYASASCSIF
ncbi:MAG: YafY family transcriptional regulator [Anaerolineae bacterium]|nr:YafY family transcriptional regulator [Anaerolineae bacterium]